VEPTDKTSAFGGREGLPADPQLASRDAGAGLEGLVLNGAYRIEEKLSEGGMGIVYKATQIALGRTVAIKTILAGARPEDMVVQRFFREARLLSQLSHPNVVQVIDFASAEPGPIYFMVMEYLRGESLEAYVATKKHLTAETVLELMAQICAGVEAAHHNQVIHRDLKPSNIFLTRITGSAIPAVKILDFGLAKNAPGASPSSSITRTGVVMGTPGYSAPEQMQGGTESDPRTDVYSLGAILYFLLTGNGPYQGQTFQSVLVKQMTRPPDPVDISQSRLPEARAIESICHKAMSIDPADRYQTPAELFADLEAVYRPGDTPSSQALPTRMERRPGRAAPPRRRAAALLYAGLLAVLIGIAAAAWWLLRPPHAGTDGPAPAGATAPGVTATDITFGMSAPFSGPAKELGRSMRTGIDTCFRQVNQAGGVHGRKLRLVALDDGYEPKRTAQNMHLLLDEHHVFGFIGNVGTPTSEVALPLALDRKRLFFAPYTGAALLRHDPPDRYVFNYRASYAEETSAIVRYLVDVKHLPPGAIAVFAQKDAYGEAGFAGVAKAVRKYKYDPDQLLRVGYVRNTTHIDEAVDAMLRHRKRVRAVIMVATYQPAALFIKRLKDQNLDAVFANISFVGSEALAEDLRELGPKYCAGVIVTQVVPHFGSDATAVLKYRQRLQKYFPEESPGFISLEGYLAALVLVRGLQDAGDNLTPDTVVDSLEAIHGLDLGVGKPITFGPSEHQASHKVWGTVLDESGTYKILDMD